jgi:uncharacterized protein YodC (DUF2158 family)
MEDTPLKVGDVVKLKSGGPKMTVIDAQYPDEVECKWFSGSETKFDKFPAAALRDASQDLS